MNLKNQKRIAASLLKCSPYKIRFDQSRLSDIKEAITKSDIKGLINSKAIMAMPVRGTSRARARKIKNKKVKGQRKGHGSRKGKKYARLPRKTAWINKIRSQRKLLQSLREKGEVDNTTFRLLYLKAKGGFFRSVRHIKLFIQERRAMQK